MAQVKVSCDSLGDLDEGFARGIIDAAINEAIRDLEDRGDDGKPRLTEIKLTFRYLENGLITTEVEAAARIPKRRTRATLAKVGREDGRPGLLFQQFAPEDPNQKTIDDIPNEQE